MFLSLFAGIGGIDLGLERAGMRCVGQVEIDPYCRKVLAKHWPDVPKFNDVRTFNGDMIHERIDVIAGGFPCIDISTMGKRRGLQGEHSGLFFEMVRIICLLRPRYVIVENTPALLERGMGDVLRHFSDLGLDAEWDVLPANAFGVRQVRKRLFIVAYPYRGESEQPHEWSVLPRQVTSAPFIDGQPIPNGVRVAHGPTDLVDIGRRISRPARTPSSRK